MEEDLNIFENGRRPPFLKKEDDLNFDPGNPGNGFFICNLISTQLYEIWKKTSIFLKMEDKLKLALGKVGSNKQSTLIGCDIIVN